MTKEKMRLWQEAIRKEGFFIQVATSAPNEELDFCIPTALEQKKYKVANFLICRAIAADRHDKETFLPTLKGIIDNAAELQSKDAEELSSDETTLCTFAELLQNKNMIQLKALQKKYLRELLEPSSSEHKVPEATHTAQNTSLPERVVLTPDAPELPAIAPEPDPIEERREGEPAVEDGNIGIQINPVPPVVPTPAAKKDEEEMKHEDISPRETDELEQLELKSQLKATTLEQALTESRAADQTFASAAIQALKISIKGPEPDPKNLVRKLEIIRDKQTTEQTLSKQISNFLINFSKARKALINLNNDVSPEQQRMPEMRRRRRHHRLFSHGHHNDSDGASSSPPSGMEMDGKRNS